MKAIILAAGLGSRLKSITKRMPKALVEVNGKTMLEHTIITLKEQGIVDFLINIHHFGQDIIDFVKHNNNFGVNISISDERGKLLDTGGAILKAHDFITGIEPVLVHNVDIVSSVSITDLYNFHTKSNSIATLCVRERESGRGLLFNTNMQLVGWTNTEKNLFRWVDNHLPDYKLFAFSGVYIISPNFTSKIKLTGSFSIIDAWLNMAKNDAISGYIDTSKIWHDLGTFEKIRNAEKNSE